MNTSENVVRKYSLLFFKKKRPSGTENYAHNYTTIIFILFL